MGRIRFRSVLALVLMSSAALLSASESFRLTLNLSNDVCRIGWMPRLIQPTNPPAIQSILPRYIVQGSSELNSWEDVAFFPGGLNVPAGPVQFSTSISCSNASAFFRVKEQVYLPGASLGDLALPGANLIGANFQRD